jgi:hypothetical protein
MRAKHRRGQDSLSEMCYRMSIDSIGGEIMGGLIFMAFVALCVVCWLFGPSTAFICFCIFGAATLIIDSIAKINAKINAKIGGTFFFENEGYESLGDFLHAMQRRNSNSFHEIYRKIGGK